MSEIQELVTPVQPQPEHIVNQKDVFRTKVKNIFVNANDRGGRPESTPSELEEVDSFLKSEDRFTDKWWEKMYIWMDQHDFHRQKDLVMQATSESLGSLPENATLPSQLKYWINKINGWPQNEAIRKQILDTLRNSSIPLSLRSQLGKYLAESDVTPYSVDSIIEDYRILGEDVGEEVRAQIFPIMLIGGAYEKFEEYKEDFINLYEHKAESPNLAPDKKQSLLGKIGSRFRRPQRLSREQELHKRNLAERRIETIRNLVLELFPPLSEDPDQFGKWKRLHPYEGVGHGGKYSDEPVSVCMSTLPVETLEKYLDDLKLLKALPEFENLSTNVASRRGKGVEAPFVALGHATTGFYDSDDFISVDSVLRYLNSLKRTEVLDERIVDEVLSGMGAFTIYDDINAIVRRNFRALIEETQLPNEYMITTNDYSMLRIRDEDAFKDRLETAKSITLAHKNYNNCFLLVYDLVDKGIISGERALELPNKASNIFSREPLMNYVFDLAFLKFPELFLKTDDGIEFLTHYSTNGIFSLDKSLDSRIGSLTENLQREGIFKFSNFIKDVIPREIERVDKLLLENSSIEITQENWQPFLFAYISRHTEPWGFPNLSPRSAERIDELFSNPKTKELCLNGLRNMWHSYLKREDPTDLSFSLNMITKFIDFCGGAGPLSQIRSLGSFINDVDNAYSKSTTVERTEVEIFNGLVKIEEKFAKERWSNEDKADFYNISRDILGAAPSIFSDCLGLFERLNPSQMKLFAKEIYPLYRTKLVLIEKIDDKGKKVYNRQQLLQLRTAIRGFVSLLNEGEKPLETQKQNLLVDIQNLIKDRFGIIKIPENFTPEHTRSIINISTYLANLHGRTPEKETIIGFYLSLMINDKWDSFRSGEEINPDEYLTHEKSSEIKSFLNNRQRLNPLNVDNLGIHQEQLSELIKLLQKEQQNIVIGNIETIDIKLTNIILNLHGLEDPDLHPDLLDKQRLKLLLNWGNRKIGSTVAKMYQKSLNPERSIQFSGEETIIQQDITSIIQESGLILNHQVLKEHFQDGIKPLATVVNLLGFVGETQAEPEIEQLRNLLEPSDKVIEIFRRLGEDFKPTSGAIALSQDLTYLDNLIVKREDELTLEERTLLTDYTTQIRKQVIKLESIYGQIKNKFAGLKQGLNTPKSPLLQDKLHEIDRIINTQTTQQVITSIMTNNLNTIIENIRECLSCTKEGSNNDTNLTFGDTNKFYLYSQTETQEKGSISDQVVFVEPTTRKDGSQSISFVLDRVYGTNTPTILENQVDTILKKCTTIRERFPKIKLTIFVSDAATKTGGISTDMFLERLRAKKITAEREIIEVNVVESSTGDHYIEFGGDARKSGKRDVDGILISA